MCVCVGVSEYHVFEHGLDVTSLAQGISGRLGLRGPEMTGMFPAGATLKETEVSTCINQL